MKLLLARRFRVQSAPAPLPAATGGVPSAVPGFRRLYDDQFAFTWRTLRYLGVPDSQLDGAVQDVWIAVHRGLGGFEERGDLETWLFGIAVNVQRNFQRTERRRGGLVPLPSELSSPMADPGLEREAQEAWEMVQGFLATLDGERRALFVSSLLEGMTPAETAAATGLEVTTIDDRVRSLRQSFRLWAEARAASHERT